MAVLRFMTVCISTYHNRKYCFLIFVKRIQYRIIYFYFLKGMTPHFKMSQTRRSCRLILFDNVIILYWFEVIIYTRNDKYKFRNRTNRFTLQINFSRYSEMYFESHDRLWFYCGRKTNLLVDPDGLWSPINVYA